MKLIVGIDFGTSTTIVKYKIEGNDTIVFIKDSDGVSDIIFTAIFRPTSTDVPTLYGEVALSRFNGGEEGELITNFKTRLLFSDPNVTEKSKVHIKEFLRYVYTCFYDQTKGLNYTDSEIYVSYPAKWSSSSLAQFMKEAVREAGFSGTIHGVFEPVAAVQNALHSHVKHLQESELLGVNKPLNILMLDMGAGTSDIYIYIFPLTLENCDGILKVIPQKGTPYPSIDDPSLCGGCEIDKMLQKLIHDHLKKTLSFDDDDLNQIFILSDAKRWKDEHLSNTLKDNQSAGLPNKILTAILPLAKYLDKNKLEAAKNFTINRASFEEKTKTHWETLYRMIQSAIALHAKTYNISAEDIDLVLLTGGHSAWYTVPKLFNGDGIRGNIGVDHIHEGQTISASHFSKIEKEPWRILSDLLPHECVAKGLVLHSEGFPIPVTSSNNVWIRLRVNENASDYVKVIKIGDPLPIKTKESELKIDFRNQRLKYIYNAYIDVLTGKDLETAELWTYHYRFNDIIVAIIAYIITMGISLLPGMDYNFILKYSFTCEGDGTPHLNSELHINNIDKIKIKF